MLGIILICGASIFIQSCNIVNATMVVKVPGHFTNGKECQDQSMEYAEMLRLAKPGDVTRIVCSYPLANRKVI